MGRHVVWTFHAVEIGRITIRRQGADEILQVTPDIRVCVFRDQQRGAGMAQEYVTDPGFHPALPHKFLQLSTYFLESTAWRGNFDCGD